MPLLILYVSVCDRKKQHLQWSNSCTTHSFLLEKEAEWLKAVGNGGSFFPSLDFGWVWVFFWIFGFVVWSDKSKLFLLSYIYIYLDISLPLKIHLCPETTASSAVLSNQVAAVLEQTKQQVKTVFVHYHQQLEAARELRDTEVTVFNVSAFHIKTQIRDQWKM